MIDTSLMPYAIAMLVVAAVATVLALGAIAVVVGEQLRDRRVPATVRPLRAGDAATSCRAA
jgi:hypothetical protein